MIESTAYNHAPDQNIKLMESWGRIWKARDSGSDAEKEIKAHAKLVSGIYFRKPETIEQETRDRVARTTPSERVRCLRQCQCVVKARGADAD
jgi:hypothetical protein